MTQPTRSRRRLWIPLLLGLVALGTAAYFLGAGDAVGWLRSLHGN